MELEDASFKEAPTTNMRTTELTETEWLGVVSILWMTELMTIFSEVPSSKLPKDLMSPAAPFIDYGNMW